MPIDEARRVLGAARSDGIFPGAVVEIGSGTGADWQEAFGVRTFDAAEPVQLDTLFDLASLTKPIATTTVALALIDAGALQLDEPIARHFAEWRGIDREDVTVRDLLEHASGLPARLVDRPPAVRREFEHEICGIRLEYTPRSRSLYSDLGFILLGFLLADVAAERLDVEFARLWPDPAMMFNPEGDLQKQAAPTEPMSDDSRRGRLLVGEVHDDYAASLGGVAGHAGLFGTAPAVGRFARMLLGAARRHGEQRASTDRPLSYARFVDMTKRSSVPGSSRALGWDRMLTTSSCGTRMSAEAFGHVGFTGTSVWIDPGRDRYFVLLTNRACRGGTIDQMREVRRAFHDALGDV